MILFYMWLNSYFLGSSISAPTGGYEAGQLVSDQWYPVPSRSGARHDGSDLGMQCLVSMVNVGEVGSSSSSGGGGCITVSMPRSELDRIGRPQVEDILKPDFMVRLHTTLFDVHVLSTFLYYVCM